MADEGHTKEEPKESPRTADLKILFVCTGNICRSPMAEAIARKRLGEAGVADVDVASTGTWGLSGAPATEFAAEVMGARGFDVAEHRARSLDPEEVRAADLVIAMTSVHLREIERAAPGSASKTLLLKEILEIEPEALPEEATLQDRLGALRQAARPIRERAHDVDDPMGLPRAVYERCADQIEAGVDRLVRLLAGSAA